VDLTRDGKPALSFTLHDAGHILGSAYVIIQWQENGRDRSLLFTGDLGRYNTPILRDPETLPAPVEHFITESTYGQTVHGPISAVEPQFLEAVQYCIQHRSRLLVPAFAVGRTQTVLWYMQKFISQGAIPAIPIFVDSPMGTDISRVHSQFPEYYDDETRQRIGSHDLFGLSRVSFTRSAQESKRINSQQGPCVIIASSPTCEFGRILHHLAQSIERENDIVLFCGYTPANTLGRRLQDGQHRVRIYDRWYDLKCQIRTVHGLSAHADGDEMLRFLAPTLRRETRAYVVHGEADQSEAFAFRLLKAGVGETVVPAMESSVISL
jgi:metallo-beta-lactamase family protein